MRFILYLFVLLFIRPATYGQMSSDYASLLKEAEQVLYTTPDQSIKIATHIAENATLPEQKIDANLLLYSAYYVKGNYNSAVHFVFEAKRISEASRNVSMQLKTGVYSLPLLYHLGLTVVAHEYFTQLNQTTKTTQTKEKQWLNIGKALIVAFDEADGIDINKADQRFIELIAQLKSSNDQLLLPIVILRASEFNYKMLRSETTVKNALDLGQPTPLNQMAQEQLLGKTEFLSKEYAKSVNHYTAALAIAKKLDNRFYAAQIEDGLAKSYLVMESKLLFQNHKKAAQLLYDEVELDEKSTINSIFNFINSNQSKKQQDLSKKYQSQVWLLAGLILLTVVLYVALRWRYRARAKQYEEFFNYFEKRQQNEEIPPKELPKNSTMPKETEALLLKRLHQFENSKQFTKHDMSLAQLAATFDSNTRYLSEVINTYKGKNFNAYVNELRINYIIDKLQNNRLYRQYKISYLADECGFSSHSSFGSVFKSVTGISPTVFIEILETQHKNTKTQTKQYEQIG